MKRIIGVISVAIIAFPGCIPGNLEDFPPPIHPDEPDATSFAEERLEVDTGELFYGTCAEMTVNPPGPDTCEEYLGSGYAVQEIPGFGEIDVAETGCLAAGGTYARAERCDETGAFGYCERSDGDNLENLRFYYPPTWTAVAAADDCENAPTGGAWHSLTEDTDLDTDTDTGAATTNPTDGFSGACTTSNYCLEYHGSGYVQAIEQSNCESLLLGSFSANNRCSLSTMVGYCVSNLGAADESVRFYYDSAFTESTARDHCQLLADSIWMPAFWGSCQDLNDDPGPGACQLFPTTSDLDFHTTLCNFSGNLSSTEPCSHHDLIGYCYEAVGQASENIIFYYSPDHDATSAQTHCNALFSSAWTPIP